jgi:hypothetical protein
VRFPIVMFPFILSSLVDFKVSRTLFYFQLFLPCYLSR